VIRQYAAWERKTFTGADVCGAACSYGEIQCLERAKGIHAALGLSVTGDEMRIPKPAMMHPFRKKEPGHQDVPGWPGRSGIILR